MKCSSSMKLVLLLFYICAAVDGKRDNENKPSTNPQTLAAFHAELRSNTVYIGGSVWVFDNVVTNVGNAYNPATGKFTAPRNGVYQFNWSTLSGPGKMSHAGLFVNGNMKGRQALNNKNGGTWITTGSSIVLALKEGDSVYIMDVHGIPSTVSGEWTTFGGVQVS